jgi:hypothetical protein
LGTEQKHRTPDDFSGSWGTVNYGCGTIRNGSVCFPLGFFLSALRFRVAVIFNGLRSMSMLTLFSERDFISGSLRAHADIVVLAI